MGIGRAPVLADEAGQRLGARADNTAQVKSLGRIFL